MREQRHMTAEPAAEINTAGAFSVHDRVTGGTQGRLSQLPLRPGSDECLSAAACGWASCRHLRCVITGERSPPPGQQPSSPHQCRPGREPHLSTPKRLGSSEVSLPRQ